jgi:predicted ATPase
MQDERLIAVVNLIAAMAKAAYQVRPEICVTICTMAVNLCLKHGNTPEAAIVYMVFGCIFLGGILGRAETGYEFGRLALGLVDKFHNDRQRAEVNFVVGYFGTSWVKPAAVAEELWEVAFQEGQRTGDLFHTGCAVSGTIQGMIMRGALLDQVEQRLEAYWPVMERAHLREPMTCLASTRRLLDRLRAGGDALSSQPDDERLLADLAAFGSRHFAHFHFLNQCMLHALTGNVAEGRKAVEQSATYLPDSKGLLNAAEHTFWSAMLHAIDPAAKSRAIKEAAQARRKFAAWTKRCPTNFALRRELLAAEEARLRRKMEAAMDHYRRAVYFGERYRCLHLLGFANQRAAQIAAGLGLAGEAGQFASAAQRAYEEWGSHALAAAARALNQTAPKQPGPIQPPPERLP